MFKVDKTTEKHGTSPYLKKQENTPVASIAGTKLRKKQRTNHHSFLEEKMSGRK
jgi:hypothetical protein